MKWTAEENEQLRELRESGKKVWEIAKAMNTSERSVRSHLVKVGIAKYRLSAPKQKEVDNEYFDWEQYRHGAECIIF